MISTDSAGNKVVGVAHAEPPSELANKVEVNAPIISDSSMEFIDEFTAVIADPTVLDILDQFKYHDRVSAAGADPTVFRYIH